MSLQQRFIAAPIIDYVPQTTSKALEEGASPTPLGKILTICVLLLCAMWLAINSSNRCIVNLRLTINSRKLFIITLLQSHGSIMATCLVL